MIIYTDKTFFRSNKEGTATDIRTTTETTGTIYDIFLDDTGVFWRPASYDWKSICYVAGKKARLLKPMQCHVFHILIPFHLVFTFIREFCRRDKELQDMP